MNNKFLILRLALGIVFLIFGIGKFQNDVWAQTIREMDIFLRLPWNINISVLLIGIMESVVGIALILGFLTRLFAALAALELLGIIILLKGGEIRDIGLFGMAIYMTIAKDDSLSIMQVLKGLKKFIALIVLISLLFQAYPANGADSGLSGEVKDGIRVIELKASRYKFEPDTIEVKLGEKIRIIATSADVPHGFGIPELKVNARINPGKTNIIEFTADKEGKFDYHCTVYCGPGHMGMRGNLIILKQ